MVKRTFKPDYNDHYRDLIIQSLLSGGRCLGAPQFYVIGQRDTKKVVVVDRWFLFEGGLKLRFDRLFFGRSM